MAASGTVNALESRKRRSQWPQIALAVALLGAFGFAGWYLLLRIPAEVPAADWLTHQGDGYSIRLPRRPDISARRGEAGDTIHLATVELPQRVYAVAWSEYPSDDITSYGADDLLDYAMQQGMAAIDGIIVDSAPLDWHGHKGRQFRADVPGGKAMYRLILVGTRMYRLAIIHAPSFAPDDEAFFGSFTVS